MIREDGYYKVKRNGNWEVMQYVTAQFVGDTACFSAWLIDGIWFSDTDFEEIDETKVSDESRNFEI